MSDQLETIEYPGVSAPAHVVAGSWSLAHDFGLERRTCGGCGRAGFLDGRRSRDGRQSGYLMPLTDVSGIGISTGTRSGGGPHSGGPTILGRDSEAY